MADSITPEMLKDAACEQIISRRRQLLAEREMARSEQAKAAAKERSLDREIAACDAAASFWGIQFQEAPSEIEVNRARTRWETMVGRANSISDDPALKAMLQQRALGAELQYRSLLTQFQATAAQLPLLVRSDDLLPRIEQPSTKAVTPKIKDIALEQLRLASPDGKKAAEIRNYVETTYALEIHEKTIGMTLYRLAKDGLVHRHGQTWFYGTQAGQVLPAEPENPGALTPGLTQDVSQKRSNAR